jgi:arginase family enzyme
LYLVSTGRDAQLALQRRLYSATTDTDVEKKWHEALDAIVTAKVCVLGVPSDVGAGFRRGANLGPQMIRQTLLEEVPDYPAYARDHAIVDVGDVFVVPQLLADDMLSEAQKEKCRAALYPSVSAADRSALPVSPLTIAERAWDLIFKLNPRVKPFALGGDHSTAWPTVAAMERRERGKAFGTYEAPPVDGWKEPPFGIVQMDAHTDLMAERLGIRMCFATWSYHANDLIGRDGRLTQVGIRATRADRGHWEKTLGVRQFWAEECNREPAAALEAIIAHVKKTGVRAVYFSNDIDGTDSAWADATGTPEPFGLTPDFVVDLVDALGRDVGLIGADIMEVAPPLKDKPDSAERTLALAVRYYRETMKALL